jgi:hypothetical protein
MNFTHTHMTQTDLGKLFGVTSHKIGQWLKHLGLRYEDGKPTEEAHDGHFCKQAPSGPTGYHWVWDSKRTVAALREADYQLVPNPPQNLMAPAILNGPFCVRKSAGSEFVIENGDGSASVWANNKMTADVVARILNLAHDKGAIDRLCLPQRLLQTTLASEKEISRVIKPFDERKGESPSQETTPHHSHNDNL